MTKSKIRDSPEAKRWLIIGAYQAGASEKHVARISGLSKTAVRNIILNYQRTGTPCIPKKIPNKIKQKLVVEYDDNGEIIDTDDEDEVQEILPPPPIPTQSTKKSITKKKPFVSIRNKPKSVTTKDIINYAMDQMRITDNNHINISAQKLVEEVRKNSLFFFLYIINI
ncbi:hypothetical protein BD770DRAFT_316997 [Pilaira anomala]|nr:hypothetical protein BD770DRAFT_316997 [Pilaira anomala]